MFSDNPLSKWPYLVLGLALLLAAYGVVRAVVAPVEKVEKTSEITPSGQEDIFSEWYQEAAGYEEAMARHEETGAPVFLYFYAPWCPYCQRFNENILQVEPTTSFLSDFIRVKIYPEVGPDEMALMDRFGARGYPTLFVKYAGMERFVVVSTTQENRLRTSREFKEALQVLRDQESASTSDSD